MKEKISGMLKSRLFKYILALVVIMLLLYAIWVLLVRELNIPIAHKTSITDGSFKTDVGKIRRISMEHMDIDRYQDGTFESIRLQIYPIDSDEVLFDKEYKDVYLKYELNKVDEFEKEDPLALPKGEYRIKCYINGEQTDRIIAAFIEYNGAANKWYFGLCIFIMICVTAALALMYFDKVKIEIAYAVLALVLGLLYNVAIPPISVWDEIDHFIESYVLSSKMIGEPPYLEMHLLLRADDYDSLEHLHDISGITGWYDSFDNGDIDTIIPLREQSQVTFKGRYSYLAQAIGISIARILHLNGHVLLLMGRILNLILTIVLIAIAIKLMPYGKWMLFMTGLLPTTLYLMGSYSYDGFNFALCALIVAFFMYMCDTKDKIGVKDILIFFVMVILMAPIKMVYLGFALLIFLIPKEKINMSKKTMGIGIGAVAVRGADVVAVGWRRVIDIFRITYIYGGGENYTLKSVLENKTQVLTICTKWLYFDAYRVFRNSLGAVNSRADIFDECHYFMPAILVVVTVLIFIVSMEDTKENKFSPVKRTLLALIAIGSFGLIAVSMLVGNTRTTDWKLTGIQGRYYLPIYTLLPAILRNKRISLKIDTKKVMIAGMTFINVCFVMGALYYFAFVYFAGVTEYTVR